MALQYGKGARLLLLMLSVKMFFETKFTFERLLTNGALKGSRVAVNNSLVCGEITLLRKCFRANRALVRFNASVNKLMLLEITLQPK